jgi:trans-aconitate methyltransferase
MPDPMIYDQAQMPVSDDAESWDNGSANDAVRNVFLIPEIQRLFEIHKPDTIIDIGTGTGYIPRSLHNNLNYIARWTLLDLNAERLAFAENHKPHSMQMACIAGDLSTLDSTANAFDCALLTFTLLEVENPAAMIAGAIDLLADGGFLVIAMPDGWRDVLTAGSDDSALPQQFLTQAVKLRKIDKFTGSPYPFSTMRIETLITTALRHDCVLETLEQGGPQGEVYVLIFRKKRLAKSATSYG